MAVAPPILADKRVLIVEDEFAIALMIGDFLEEFGCVPVGPCGTLAHAMEAIQTETFDLAVLDVNLNGERIYPVAEVLADRHIPFLIVSGYGDYALPAGRSGWKVCAKPFRGEDFATQLAAVLNDAHAATRPEADRSVRRVMPPERRHRRGPSTSEGT